MSIEPGTILKAYGEITRMLAAYKELGELSAVQALELCARLTGFLDTMTRAALVLSDECEQLREQLRGTGEAKELMDQLIAGDR